MSPPEPSHTGNLFLSNINAEWELPCDDKEALNQMFSLAYEELRRLASAVRRDHPEATLSPTALVNEAWLKLSKGPSVSCTSQLHFKRIAARAMRQVLIDAARRRNRTKRSATMVALDDFPAKGPQCDERLLALNTALEELATMNPRHAVVVESRFFGGMEVNEITALLGISETTVLRDWRAARAWLAQRLDLPASADGF